MYLELEVVECFTTNLFFEMFLFVVSNMQLYMFVSS